MKRVVTIQDIADQLGLSRNTVAKALNGQYVAQETREKVLQKARELNYKSMGDRPAEAAVAKRYRILLVSGKPLTNINYFIPIVKGMENFCFERNIEFFQHTYNVRTTDFTHFTGYVKELKVDGIVAIECFDKSFIARLVNLGKPLCFIDFTATPFVTPHRFDILGTNDEAAICEIVKRLHARYNISNFTFVGDRMHCMSFHERYMGMLKGIAGTKNYHSRKDDILCNDENFQYGDIAAIKTELLKLTYKSDCFICCNDFVARSVCTAVKELGYRVPQDVFVVGFDNVTEAISLEPRITTFSVDKDFMGRETLRTLLHRIENPDIPSRNITVNTTAIARESTERPL